ncbi:tyrosine-type recombinase/integrase [Orbus mooreae]|uniref:tyrosine-type recombinase/integrase n=1 Tax=Orbus mooreae TaxID=3074107 RepID=UPI00370D32D8
MKLTDLKIKLAKPKKSKYRLNDGHGLVIIVYPNGAKIWNYRYQFNKKEQLLSLGEYPIINLLDAREKRDEAKKVLLAGGDPKNRATEDKTRRLSEVSLEWVNSQRKWSEPHKKRIISSLTRYLLPTLGNRELLSLTTKDLLIPIKQVENTGKIELATRLQQRIKAILRYAIQQGYLNYNPAQDLSGVVAKQKTTHHPTLDFSHIPELLNRIDSYKGKRLTYLTLKLQLLTFTLSSELRFARWSEIDFDNQIWTIPATREAIKGVRYSERGSKMKTPHIVPLSQQVIAILMELKTMTSPFDLILTADNSAYKPISENTINKALRSLGYDTKTELCGHGFRSMACSALVESNLWSKDAIERQMSHQERNHVRAAYIHKAEHLNVRIKMMQWWANWLDKIRDEYVAPYDYISN